LSKNDISVDFSCTHAQWPRVQKSLERFSKKCASRDIPFKYEFQDSPPPTYRAFVKCNRKYGSVFDEQFQDMTGAKWRFNPKVNRRLYRLKSPDIEKIWRNLDHIGKLHTPPEVFKESKFVGYSTVQIKAQYTPPSKWRVITVCDPADPNNPQDTPAIYTPMFGEKIPERVGRKKLPHKYTDQCDHCTSGKRRRKQVYIVESPKGQKRYVGKTCLKSYTGLDPKDLEDLLCYAKASPEEPTSHGGRVSETTFETSLMNMLIGAYATQKMPYKSGLGRSLLFSFVKYLPDENLLELGRWDTDLRGRRTWEPQFKIANIFDLRRPDDLPSDWQMHMLLQNMSWRPSAKIMMLASDFAQAVEDMKNDRPSDFTRKVLSVAECGVVQRKTWNVYAGASSRWLKKIHEQWFNEKSDIKPEQKTVAHTGEVGERITVKVFYHSQRETKNGYTITEFRTKKNEAFVTFGTADISQIKTGDKLLLTGTIKRHGAFNGNGSTTLNRIQMTGGWKA